MLFNLVNRGAFDRSDYDEASARLVGYRYCPTRYDTRTFLAACREAGWQTSAWPLRQSILAVTDANAAGNSIARTADLIITLFDGALLHPGVEEVALSLLGRETETDRFGHR